MWRQILLLCGYRFYALDYVYIYTFYQSANAYDMLEGYKPWVVICKVETLNLYSE